MESIKETIAPFGKKGAFQLMVNLFADRGFG
jgi:hypothetical protein